MSRHHVSRPGQRASSQVRHVRDSRRGFVKKATVLGMSFTAIPFVPLSFRSGTAFAAAVVPASDKIRSLKVSVTNCFLLECNGGHLLIDTPYPGKYDLLVAGLKEMGVEVSSIRYLLLTHHHDDHVGCVNELVRDSGARIIVHEKALPHLAAGRSDTSDRPINTCIHVLMGTYGLFHEYKFPPLHLTESDIVIDGDDANLLSEIGIDGEILYTPGHTVDSISIVLADGSALVGDAASNFLHFCFVRHRPIYVNDENAVFESWKKLKEHGAKTIHPSHGDPFDAGKLVAPE